MEIIFKVHDHNALGFEIEVAQIEESWRRFAELMAGNRTWETAAPDYRVMGVLQQAILAYYDGSERLVTLVCWCLWEDHLKRVAENKCDLTAVAQVAVHVCQNGGLVESEIEYLALRFH